MRNGHMGVKNKLDSGLDRTHARFDDKRLAKEFNFYQVFRNGKPWHFGGMLMKIQFLRIADQPACNEYWGDMRFLGRLAPDACMYAVDFKIKAPHRWHYHRQDELIVVTRGRIRQKIKSSTGRITHNKILKAGEAVHLPRRTWHSAAPLDLDTKVVITIKGGNGKYCAYEEGKKIIHGPAE
jgi:quercetin dioxygenase-like cupin family protein